MGLASPTTSSVHEGHLGLFSFAGKTASPEHPQLLKPHDSTQNPAPGILSDMAMFRQLAALRAGMDHAATVQSAREQAATTGHGL